MPGIRIRHHTRRNQMLPVPLLHKPFPAAHQCHVCHTTHPCKVLHLNLDTTGAVIVSREIWADLQRTTNRGGFTLVNPVLRPPTQTIQPPTIKVKLKGIDIVGLTDRPKQQTFTPSRNRAGTGDATADTTTMTLDEYVDVAGEHGVTLEAALNLLMVKLLSGETSGQGKGRTNAG